MEAPERIEPARWPHFTLRGRRNKPVELRVALDSDSSAVDSDVFLRAARWAMARWSEAGAVEFELVEDAAQAEVVVSWHAEDDEQCLPFLVDGGVAHAGPMEERSFVHLDASRRWDEGEDRDHSLRQALLHELGHVLGLGHSSDPAAVMNAQPDARRSVLTESDRAGLATLYGGMEQGPGDLLVLRDGPDELGQAPLCALRRIAAPQVTGWGIFDTDGDGADELLLWRTDADGFGNLQVFYFSAGPQPERTIGPLYGVLAPNSTLAFAQDLEGRALLVNVLRDGRLRVLRLEGEGQLVSRAPLEGLELVGGGSDLDGDGFLDELDALDPHFVQRRALPADLDGDGRPERVVSP